MRLLSRNEEILLVAVLRLKDNAYGVTIRGLVSRMTGYTWTFGVIYVFLDKLVRKGLLEKASSNPTAQRGGRSKCMYVLSPRGFEALNELQEMHDMIWKSVSAVALGRGGQS